APESRLLLSRQSEPVRTERTCPHGRSCGRSRCPHKKESRFFGIVAETSTQTRLIRKGSDSRCPGVAGLANSRHHLRFIESLRRFLSAGFLVARTGKAQNSNRSSRLEPHTVHPAGYGFLAIFLRTRALWLGS